MTTHPPAVTIDEAELPEVLTALGAMVRLIGLVIIIVLLLVWWVLYSIGAVGFWWEQ